MTDLTLIQEIFGKKLQQKMTLQEAILLLSEKKLIDIGEVAELAISKGSGVDMCAKNTANIDLVTGYQVKHGQTNPDHVSRGTLKAHISIRGITTTILAVVTERVSRKQYYFCFPYSSFEEYAGNTFHVVFKPCGSPSRKAWTWAYEVGSFKELCEIAKRKI